MAIDPKQVQAAFLEVVAAEPDQRGGIMERLCAGNAELRRRVEVLVRAHDDSGELPPVGGDLEGTGAYQPNAVNVAPRVDLQPGSLFAGRYKLREKLGEGGMGIVWVADQTEPVQRRVALKVIKAADDSRRLLARFEQERQALALMDHPNIAKVFDAGISDDGRPYFVMELIKGIPLTKYCDEAKLSPKQRLELFVPVCQAVQHAHQKGIIHRDLKPSNILIGLYDGRPVPKVIDFGVAKATGPRLSKQSIYTEIGSLIGTLEYMSPEQAELNNLDIDTRSDIYALGVILYELLTGGVPFSRADLKSAGFGEMLRIIKEVEPPKPSTRLSGTGTLPSVAACRHTEPSKLSRLVRGELDWIVMKCLEKDRSRRYETANGLSMDIQHYLADEPVAAGPPSATYRLRKFVKKHRGPVTAGLTVMLLLVLGIAGTSWGLVEARSQRDQAEAARKAEAKRAESERFANVEAQNQKTYAERARDDEARERIYAEAITAFVKDDFLALTSVEGQMRFGGEELTRDTTLRELLDRAAEKLKGRKGLAPRTEAELSQVIGESYVRIGEYPRAIPFLKRSVELHRQLSGADAEATLNARNSLGIAYNRTGHGDLAMPLFVETLKLVKAKFGPEHPNTLIITSNVAETHALAGNPALALPLFEETLKLQKIRVGTANPYTLITMNGLAQAYRAAGNLDLAVPLLEETLMLTKAKRGINHPHTLTSMNNLAKAYQAAGRLDLALPLFEETLKLEKAKREREHPNTLACMSNLGNAYQDAGRPDLALPLFEEALVLWKAKLGDKHIDTLTSMNNLANAYRAAGRLDRSLPLYEETLKLMKANLGDNHRNTLACMGGLAAAYGQGKRLDKSIPLFEKTLELKKAHLGTDDPATLDTMNDLAGAYWRTKQLDKSIPLFEETLKRKELKLGRENQVTLRTVANLGVNYKDAGRFAEAIPLLEEAHRAAKKYPSLRWVGTQLHDAYAKAREIPKLANLLQEQLPEARKSLPKESPQLAGLLAQIGMCLLEQKKWAEAEPFLRECVAIREKTEADDWTTFNIKSMLGKALLGQKKYAEAETLLLAGYEGMKKREKTIPLPGGTRIPEAIDQLVRLYEATGKKDDAAKWRLELAKYPEVAPMPREKK